VEEGNKMEFKSFEIAKKFLGKEVDFVIDRPFGSKHPKHDFIYEVNYGYVPGIKAPDGEDLDIYFLGINIPVEKGSGIAKAIIHRLDDDDDKLVVMSKEISMTDEEIEKAVMFQEKWFKHEIIR
jgi:inorganic pyrophosphatase